MRRSRHLRNRLTSVIVSCNSAQHGKIFDMSVGSRDLYDC
jgi:hypothetical protein